MTEGNREEVVLFNSPLLELAFRRSQQEKARKRRQLEAMAADGVPSAQRQLGLSYATGANGCGVDLERAMELLRAAKDQGDREARNYLAICCRKKAEQTADGVEKERLRRDAAELFAEGAEDGDPFSIYYLGLAYENGSGVARAPEKALECYRQSSAKGNLSALTALGVCYFSGIGTARDVPRGLERLEQAAKRGDPRAQCILGDIYLGQGEARFDPARAKAFYEAAAGQRYPRAFAALAVIYGNGLGCAAEPEKAVELLEKAAEGGFSPAIDCLREMGRDVSRFTKGEAQGK